MSEHKDIIAQLSKINRRIGDLYHEKAFLAEEMMRDDRSEIEVIRSMIRLLEVASELNGLIGKRKVLANQGLEMALKKRGVPVPADPPVPVNDDPNLG